MKYTVKKKVYSLLERYIKGTSLNKKNRQISEHQLLLFEWSERLWQQTKLVQCGCRQWIIGNGKAHTWISWPTFVSWTVVNTWLICGRRLSVLEWMWTGTGSADWTLKTGGHVHRQLRAQGLRLTNCPFNHSQPLTYTHRLEVAAAQLAWQANEVQGGEIEWRALWRRWRWRLGRLEEAKEPHCCLSKNQRCGGSRVNQSHGCKFSHVGSTEGCISNVLSSVEDYKVNDLKFRPSLSSGENCLDFVMENIRP